MLEEIKFYFTVYPAKVVTFLVFIVASIPVLVYYRRKNPNPRFRPSFGEMTLVSVFAVMISLGLAVAIGSVFDSEHSLRKMRTAKGTEGNFGDPTARGGSDGKEDPDKKKKKDDLDALAPLLGPRN